jgi:hypothetical protein
MVPCIDLANHAANDATIAIYEQDIDGNAILVLHDGKTLKEDDEVTISYGDAKGACEMIFSYGFLDSSMASAETLFLSLSPPSGNSLTAAKTAAADCAPGFKLIDRRDDMVDWTGDFIWMLCIDSNDGLHFELARTTDGDEEVHAFFNDVELTGGAAQLQTLLAATELWDVHKLRAVSILQARVFDQLQVLYGSQEAAEAADHGDGTGISDQVYGLAMKLRQLEFELLDKAYEVFEQQVRGLDASIVFTGATASVRRASTRHLCCT